MKLNINDMLSRVAAMVRRSPVEISLVVSFIIYGSLLIWEGVSGKGDDERMWLWWFAFTAACILNDLTRGKNEKQDKNDPTRSKNAPAAEATETKTAAADKPCGKLRWLYCLTPLAAIALWWSNWNGWMENHTIAFVTAVLLCPAAMLLYRWRRDNLLFVSDVAHWVKNGLFAAVLAGVAHLVIIGIYQSLHYIFPNLPLGDDSKMMIFFALVCWGGIMPLVFLTLDGEHKESFVPARFMGAVVNWVLTPALLIYTAILYAYFIKITVSWSLPKGGIAWMVFAFAMVALAVKAFLPLLEKRRGEWFYNRFSLVSLPALAMFWIGISRRVNDYGLTVDRINLIVCGAVMTFTVLMFLVPRVAKYRYGIAGGALLFALLAFVPGISSQRLALRSQENRLVAAARQLGVMGADGKITLGDIVETATTDEHKKDFETVRESLIYIARQTSNTEVEEQYGVDPYELPEEFEDGISHRSIYLTADGEPFSMAIGSYKTMHKLSEWHRDRAVYRYEVRDEVLTVTTPTGEVLLKCDLSDIFERQMAKAGIPHASSAPSSELLDEHFADMMLFEDERFALVFTMMHITAVDGTPRLEDVSIDWVLLK